MSEPMFRPRSAIEIVDAGFSIYRAHFATLAAIWIVLLGPFAIVGFLIGGPFGELISNASGFAMALAVGATVAVVSDAMHDRAVSLASAFGQTSGRSGTLLVVSFAQGILTFLGALLLIIPGVIVWCWTFAAPMTVVVERVSGTSEAISRSKQLARGQFWHILGSLAMSWLIVFVLVIAGAFGTGLIAGLIGLGERVQELLFQWVLILALPVTGATSGVLYFDLRVRNDGYDVERLAQTLDESVAAPVNTSWGEGRRTSEVRSGVAVLVPVLRTP